MEDIMELIIIRIISIKIDQLESFGKTNLVILDLMRLDMMMKRKEELE